MLTSSRTRLAIAIAIAIGWVLVVATAGIRTYGQAQAPLTSALTFHASFDKGPDADFGLGDKRIYGAASYRNLAEAQPGLRNPDATIAANKGRYGAALEFTAKTTAIYYQADKNVEYRRRDWNGTVSFWLGFDPEQDLTGFADPIQMTDKDYNNAALWVDFPNDTPRPDPARGVSGPRGVESRAADRTDEARVCQPSGVGHDAAVRARQMDARRLHVLRVQRPAGWQREVLPRRRARGHSRDRCRRLHLGSCADDHSTRRQLRGAV